MVATLQKHSDPLVFIDQVLAWYTQEVEFVEVSHEKRAEGDSGYSIFQLINLALKLIIYYTDLPLRLMVYLGMGTSITSFIIGTYYIYQKMVYDAELGFTSIIVSLFFATSLILFSLGILGLYITRIYITSIKKPLYSVKVKR